VNICYRKRVGAGSGGGDAAAGGIGNLFGGLFGGK